MCIPAAWSAPLPLLRVQLTLFIKKYLFIYLTEDEREREREGGREHKQGEQQAEGEGEAGFPQSREPHVVLEPRTLGS